MMVALIKCHACRAGDCANCEGGGPAPEGVMGGTECPCEGKCKPEPNPMVDAMVEAVTPQPPDRVEPDEGPTVYFSREPCGLCGSRERDFNTDECVGPTHELRPPATHSSGRVEADERVEWVGQGDEWGCGIAVLAMLTGQSYAEVDAAFPYRLGREDERDKCVKPREMMGYLWDQGYSLRVIRDRRYAINGYNGVWPSLVPFAPLHYAMVDSPTQPTGHWIALDSEARVFDPFTAQRETLGCYGKMHEVVGVWPEAASTAEHERRVAAERERDEALRKVRQYRHLRRAASEGGTDA
jgi:hypothetical protein